MAAGTSGGGAEVCGPQWWWCNRRLRRWLRRRARSLLYWLQPDGRSYPRLESGDASVDAVAVRQSAASARTHDPDLAKSSVMVAGDERAAARSRPASARFARSPARSVQTSEGGSGKRCRRSQAADTAKAGFALNFRLVGNSAHLVWLKIVVIGAYQGGDVGLADGDAGRAFLKARRSAKRWSANSQTTV